MELLSVDSGGVAGPYIVSWNFVIASITLSSRMLLKRPSKRAIINMFVDNGLFFFYSFVEANVNATLKFVA